MTKILIDQLVLSISLRCLKVVLIIPYTHPCLLLVPPVILSHWSGNRAYGILANQVSLSCLKMIFHNWGYFPNQRYDSGGVILATQVSLRWSQMISHTPKPGDRHQNQVSSTF